jgi:hypothetical protein
MKKEKNWRARVLRPIILIGIVAGIIWASAGPYPRIVQDEDTRSWHVVWEGSFAEAAEADPGAGASGILEVFIYATGGTYTTNLTEGDADTFGWASADATEIDVPHSTAFDVVVKVRGNATHCKRDTTWYDTDLRVRITWSDKGLSDEVAESNIIVNNTNNEFLWMNFHIDNSNSGYTITKSETTEIQNIKFEAYY